MSKLLQTQLPLAIGPVDPELFNRLVRILEINLGAIDLDNVRQISDPEKNTLKFRTVAVLSFDMSEIMFSNADKQRM